MKKRAREKARDRRREKGIEDRWESIGGSSSSAAGNTAASSSANIYVDTATPRDQPAIGGSSSEVQGESDLGAEKDQPATGGVQGEFEPDTGGIERCGRVMPDSKGAPSSKPKRPLRTPSRSPPKRVGKGGNVGQDSGGPTQSKGKGDMGKQPAIGGKPRQVHQAQVAIGTAPKEGNVWQDSGVSTKAKGKGDMAKQPAIGGKPRQSYEAQVTIGTAPKGGKEGIEGKDSGGPTNAKGKGDMGKQLDLGGKPRQVHWTVHQAKVALGAVPTKARPARRPAG